MCKYLILIMLCYSGLCCFAQEKDYIDMVKILGVKRDFVSLEKKIKKAIEYHQKTSGMKDMKRFYIFRLKSNNNINNKEEFLDYSFLHKLTPENGYNASPRYWLLRKTKLDTYKVYITDSIGNLIAKYSAPYSYETYLEKGDEKLAKVLFNNNFDFVFLLSASSSYGYMIGIKENKLYAIDEYENGIYIYSWEEFMKILFL